LHKHVAREQQLSRELDDDLDTCLGRQLVAADVLHLARVGIEVEVEQLIGDDIDPRSRLTIDRKRPPFGGHTYG